MPLTAFQKRATWVVTAATATALVAWHLLSAERRRWAKRLKKVELHLHLDGSLRPSTFLELHNALPVPENGTEEKDPYGHDVAGENFRSVRDIEKRLCFVQGWDLKRCLASFGYTNKVLQTAEALERVAFECCEDLWNDGVSYAEIRYCPSLHRANGLSLDAIVSAVARGLSRGNRTFAPSGPPCFNQIITALRDLGPAEALAMAELAVKHQKAGSLVVGFGECSSLVTFLPSLPRPTSQAPILNPTLAPKSRIGLILHLLPARYRWQ